MLKKYLTETEQIQLLSAPKKLKDVLARRDYAWMSLLKDTGFRITEFSRISVRAAMLALQTGYIYIPREHRKGQKRDHSKLVTEPVRTALLDLLDIRREMGYLDDGEVPLIMTRKHVGMSVRAFQHRIAYWARIAGIQGKVSPHWLRHTRAMNIMRRSNARDPRGIVQAELGHDSITSSGIYTGVTREELIEALNEVDGPRRYRKRDMRGFYQGRVTA
jgi:site-specific recombinase XerD